ncbi:MAG: DNA polymerase I [Candidatus Midichloria sp.]|nr:DNA polymerase I [Candidatus Midichloria sp.]
MHLYLVDGYGFVFRAYHSLPPLSSPDGTPISAVYGFVNMMIKLCESHKADMIAVVLDSGSKNHRHELFPEYKANRPTLPDNLKVQFPIIREALQALNITIVEVDGHEADDLIATYAVKAVKSGNDVTIISSDKDLMQLLSYSKIYMHDPIKNKSIIEEDVEKKFGIRPRQLTDALALIGDTSDNIPGVPGIGPKTAADLLKDYSSLDEIYKNIDSIKSARIRQLLIDNQEQAILFRNLVTLKTDISTNLNLEEMRTQQPDPEHLVNFARKFGFKSLIAKYAVIANESHSLGYEKIELKKINKSDLKEKLLRKIEKGGVVACYFNDKEFFLATNELNLIIDYEDITQKNLFDVQHAAHLNDILSFLKPVFESDSITKILFDAKLFIKILYKLSIRIVAFEDLAIMAYSISTKNQYKDLVNLISESYFNAFGMIRCYARLKYELISLKILSLYEKLEKPLIKVLSDMESRGILVDKQVLDEISLDLNGRAKIIADSIYKIANQEFNIGSTKQLGEILFEKLKLVTKSKKSSKSRNYSTDSNVLEALALQGYEIASLILEWRHLTKLVNTYTEALQKSIDPNTTRIHTTFDMNTTTTGRLSSRNPNLQNIPIRTEEGRWIRKAFVASKGKVLISADYSQIELRLLAHFADIKQLKEAFLYNRDIHAVTASEIFGVPIQNIDSDLRRKAKGINFGIIYGISPFGLAKNIGIPQREAKKYIENYFLRYPGIHEYMKKILDFAKANNFVETIFKRRCFIEGINSSNYTVRSFAERAAINAPLQGSAADIIKKAMVMLPEHLSRYLVLQIHDELLFDVPEAKTEMYAQEIVSIMENVVQLSAPLKVGISVGKSW